MGHRVAIQGLRRTGTNWLKALLLENFEDIVIDQYVYKHGVHVAGLEPDDLDVRFVTVKNPFSWAASQKRFTREQGGIYPAGTLIRMELYVHTLAAQLASWDANTVLVRYEELLEDTRGHLVYYEDEFGFVPSQDMVDTVETRVVPGMVDHTRPDPFNIYWTGDEAFDASYYLERRYLSELSKRDVEEIDEVLHREYARVVMERVGYADWCPPREGKP